MTDTCPTCSTPVTSATMEQLENSTWVSTLRPCGHVLLEQV